MRYQSMGGAVVRAIAEDGAVSFVPAGDPSYRAWVAAGNTAEAADPAPLVYDDGLTIRARLRTTNATPAELWRATLAQRTGYRAVLTLIAMDVGNESVRTIEARITAKRLAGNALLVGSPVIVADQQDAGTAAWGIAASVSGTDFVVTVTGAAGLTIAWFLDGRVVSFTPGGR